MGKVTEAEVEKIARLAHLDVTESEKRNLCRQLNEILAYAERIQSLDTEVVEPISHLPAGHDALREDQPRACLPRKEAMRIAPEKESGLIKVPKIIP